MLEKESLLEAIAGKNRGLLTTDNDKIAILSIIARLEDRNPTPRPLEASELLDGDWRLLYTSSRSLLNIDQIPLVKLGQIYQSIRIAETKIYNIAEVYGLPYLEGLIGVAARFEAISERRVQVKFERSILGLQRLIGYQSPANLIDQIASGKKFTAIDLQINNPNQQGWLDITYLDRDMRIGRGNEGNVFVLTKT